MDNGTGIKLKETSYTDPRFELYNNLYADASRFAVFREAQKTRQLNAAKTDSDRAAIENRYQAYLKSEEQTIFGQAAAAEQWVGFTENADLYPNVEYDAVIDEDTTSICKDLNGMVFALTDPRLKKIAPTNHFGCRSQLLQTDKPVSKNIPNVKAPKGFDFNPGTDQKLFADSAGYYTNATHAEQLNITARTLSGNTTRSEMRQQLKGSNNILQPGGDLKGNKITLSNADVKIITGKNHDNQTLRNTLLYDIKNISKNAGFVKAVPESHTDKRHKKYDTWYYYKTKGVDNMYLNFVKYRNGTMKLHAITDKLMTKK